MRKLRTWKRFLILVLCLSMIANGSITAMADDISGEESKIELNDIIQEFGDKVDCYIDGGKSKIGIGSTVLQILNNELNILREGVISREEIIEVYNRYKLS